MKIFKKASKKERMKERKKKRKNDRKIISLKIKSLIGKIEINSRNK